MKLSFGITLLLTQLATTEAFAPSSSFTSFSASSQSFQSKNVFTQPISRRQNGSEMKMMFDQLSNAISEVAKNIGGRQK